MSRLIDKEPNTKFKPFRVACAGLGRTGTTSMYFALRELGFNPYHGYEYPTNPKRHFTLWTEAIRCNFLGQGRRYGREEFDRLLGPYDACMDLPACLFWEDLHRVYPDAKIILTSRDAASWLRSMQETIFKFVQWKIWRIWQFVDYEETRPMMVMLDTSFKVFCNNDYGNGALQAYLDHNERVRKTIPEDQLLEFKLGDGWEPLCRFLDVPIPVTPFPHKNTSKTFKVVVEEEAWNSIVRSVKRVAYCTFPVLVAGVGIWYWYFRR